MKGLHPGNKACDWFIYPERHGVEKHSLHPTHTNTNTITEHKHTHNIKCKHMFPVYRWTNKHQWGFLLSSLVRHAVKTRMRAGRCISLAVCGCICMCAYMLVCVCLYVYVCLWYVCFLWCMCMGMCSLAYSFTWIFMPVLLSWCVCVWERE